MQQYIDEFNEFADTVLQDYAPVPSTGTLSGYMLHSESFFARLIEYQECLVDKANVLIGQAKKEEGETGTLREQLQYAGLEKVKTYQALYKPG